MLKLSIIMVKHLPLTAYSTHFFLFCIASIFITLDGWMNEYIRISSYIEHSEIGRREYMFVYIKCDGVMKEDLHHIYEGYEEKTSRFYFCANGF